MKYKFKYQQGGSPRVYTTPIPDIQTQAFTPLIQQASQPLDTGFESLKLFESLKMQKKQEERLNQQNEFDKLRFAAQQEQLQFANEDRLLKRSELINDKLLNVDATPVDIPILEDLKEKYGVTAKYQNLAKSTTRENSDEYSKAVSSMAADPEFKRILRRSEAYKFAENRKKTEFVDAIRDGGFDSEEYNKFLTDPNMLAPTLRVTESYTKDKALDSQIKEINRQTKDFEVKDAEFQNGINSKIYEILTPLMEEYKNNPTDELMKKIQEWRGKLQGRGSSGTQQKAYDASTYEADMKAQSRIDRTEAYINNNKMSRADAIAKVEEEDRIAKQVHENDVLNPGDRVYDTDKNSFLKNYNTLEVSPKKMQEFTNDINTHVYDAVDKNGVKFKSHLNVQYSNGGVTKNEQLGGSVAFVPSPKSSVTSDSNTYVSGTVYKSIDPANKQAFIADGWQESHAPSLGAGTGFAPKAGNIIVSKPGTVAMNSGSNDTTAPTTATTSTGKAVPKVATFKDYKAEFAKNNVIVKDGTDTVGFIDKAPVKARETVLGVGKYFGKEVVVSGWGHHGNKNNFDISQNSSKFDASDLYKPEFKNWLKTTGYAVVYEHKGSTASPVYKNLKPGEVVTSKWNNNTTADHYHFEYVGGSDPRPATF